VLLLPQTNFIRPADNEKKVKTNNKVPKYYLGLVALPVCSICHQTVGVFKVFKFQY